MKTPDAMLSLLGDDSPHDFCSEDEELNNDDLLSQINTSSDDTGLPVSDKLSNLLTTSFRLNIPLKNVKRYYRSTKYQVIAMNCLCLKLTQRFGPNLMQTPRG